LTKAAFWFFECALPSVFCLFLISVQGTAFGGFESAPFGQAIHRSDPCLLKIIPGGPTWKGWRLPSLILASTDLCERPGHNKPETGPSARERLFGPRFPERLQKWWPQRPREKVCRWARSLSPKRKESRSITSRCAGLVFSKPRNDWRNAHLAPRGGFKRFVPMWFRRVSPETRGKTLERGIRSTFVPRAPAIYAPPHGPTPGFILAAPRNPN